MYLLWYAGKSVPPEETGDRVVQAVILIALIVEVQGKVGIECKICR